MEIVSNKKINLAILGNTHFTSFPKLEMTG